MIGVSNTHPPTVNRNKICFSNRKPSSTGMTEKETPPPKAKEGNGFPVDQQSARAFFEAADLMRQLIHFAPDKLPKLIVTLHCSRPSKTD
jgi:hypothetical protein